MLHHQDVISHDYSSAFQPQVFRDNFWPLLHCLTSTCFDYYSGFPRFLESPATFSEISRTRKVSENEFDAGKSWKLKLKVLDNPGISLWFKLTDMRSTEFGLLLNVYWNKATVNFKIFGDDHSALDCTVTSSNWNPGKTFLGVLEKSGIFVSKRVGTWLQDCFSGQIMQLVGCMCVHGGEIWFKITWRRYLVWWFSTNISNSSS